MCHYICHYFLATDRLLTTHRDTTYSPGYPKHKIGVLHNIEAGLLFHLHNNHTLTQYPSQAQLKQIFNHTFYKWNLKPLLEQLYKHCYQCIVHQQQYHISTSNKLLTEAQIPHRYFHVDVIKRDKRQNILLDTNNFSTKSSALQVKSDIANDLSDGLIILRSSMRHP